MSRITIHELYNGEKYDVLSKALNEYLINGKPSGFDERAWVDLLLMKHTILEYEKMKTEGDTLSGLYDGESSSL